MNETSDFPVAFGVLTDGSLRPIHANDNVLPVSCRAIVVSADQEEWLEKNRTALMACCVNGGRESSGPEAGKIRVKIVAKRRSDSAAIYL